MWARENEKTHFAYRATKLRCMIDAGDGSDACNVNRLAANPTWSQYEITCTSSGGSDGGTDTSSPTREPTMEPTPPDQTDGTVETCAWVDMCPDDAWCHCNGQYEQTSVTSAECRAQAETGGWSYYMTRNDIDRCRQPIGDVETNCRNGGSPINTQWTTYKWECSGEDDSSDDGSMLVNGCTNSVVDLGGYHKCTGTGLVIDDITLAECARQAYERRVYYYSYLESSSGILRCKIPADASQAQELCMGPTTWEWQVYHLDCSSSDQGGDSGDGTTDGGSEDSTDLDTKTPTREPTSDPIGGVDPGDNTGDDTASCEGSAPYIWLPGYRCVAGQTTILGVENRELCSREAVESGRTYFEWREDRKKCGVPKENDEQCSGEGKRPNLPLWSIYTTECNPTNPSENDQTGTESNEPVVVVYDTPDADKMGIIRHKFTKNASSKRFGSIGDLVDEILDAGLNYDPQVQEKFEEMQIIHGQAFTQGRFTQSGVIFAEIDAILNPL